MNICVVSTFDGTIDEYMALMAEFEEEMKQAGASFDVGVVDTGIEGRCKVINMANITDMDKMQEIMSSPKMIAWDKAHNNTDVVYSLEKMG